MLSSLYVFDICIIILFLLSRLFFYKCLTKVSMIEGTMLFDIIVCNNIQS